MIALAILVALAVGAPAGAQAETTGLWSVYKNCPYNSPEMLEAEGSGSNCVYGVTHGGKEGGQFTVGSVSTPLSKKIILQGGVIWKENPETGVDEGRLVPPTSGKLLTAPPLVVPKGLRRITPQIQEEAEWPQELRQAFTEAEHNHEGDLYATIELAGGNQVYEERNALSTQNLVNEEGTAFELPLKVKLSGPLLGRLQGGQESCYIGTESHPVVQHLTTGPSGDLHGFPGELEQKEEFDDIVLKGSRLVDNTWPVEVGAEGCGGPYEAYVNRALDILLRIPAEPGASSTELKGSLYSGLDCSVKRNAETGWTEKHESKMIIKWETEEHAHKITAAQREEKEKEAEYGEFKPGEYEGEACVKNPDA
jgi:hypothetical protein